MRSLKFIHTSIVLLLCICILGFFANWAQNDYGMNLVLFCLLGVGILLAISSVIYVGHKKYYRELLALCFLFPFLLPLFVSLELQIGQIMFLSLSSVLLQTLIIPIFIFFSEKNKPLKTDWNSFYPSIFVSLFCLGNCLRMLHLPGASVVLVSSSFILIPYYSFAFRKLKSSFQTKSFADLFLVLLHLFNGTTILAYCFKLLHWPLGSILANFTVITLFLLIISALLVKIKQQNLQATWLSLPWVKRLIFVCFTLTSIHYFLRITDITPPLYSNEYPAALQELWGNANNITKEGKVSGKKAAAYYDNYLNFIDKREEAAQKIKGE